MRITIKNFCISISLLCFSSAWSQEKYTSKQHCDGYVRFEKGAFCRDSLFNWYYLDELDSTQTLMGNYPNCDRIYIYNDYYHVGKFSEDTNQFYPDPIISSEFEPIIFPEGTNYIDLLKHGFAILSNHERKNNETKGYALYDIENHKLISEWYRTVYESREDDNIIITIDSNENKKIIELKDYRDL